MYAESYETISRETQGLSHEDSLMQPPGALNCLNWMVGHVMASRSNVLAMLGEPSVWGWAEARRYIPGSEPITTGEDALDFAQILADLKRSQRQLLRFLGRATPEAMGAECDASYSEALKTLGAQLAFAQAHEAYHAGQVELLRRLIGGGTRHR
jgi:hypothetical protein